MIFGLTQAPGFELASGLAWDFGVCGSHSDFLSDPSPRVRTCILPRMYFYTCVYLLCICSRAPGQGRGPWARASGPGLGPGPRASGPGPGPGAGPGPVQRPGWPGDRPGPAPPATFVRAQLFHLARPARPPPGPRASAPAGKGNGSGRPLGPEARGPESRSRGGVPGRSG